MIRIIFGIAMLQLLGCAELELVSSSFNTQDEFTSLKKVIIGLPDPFWEDKAQARLELTQYPQIPFSEHRAEVLRAEYPTKQQLQMEYAEYVAILEKYGVEVLRPDPSQAYSFDYTCPRDLGFVVGEYFILGNMGVESRADEYKTILPILSSFPKDKIARAPKGALLEGGDVILMGSTLLVGINRRTNEQGYEFLKELFEPMGYNVVPVYHRQLHLDCCFNVLGRGHALVHPSSLSMNSAATLKLLKSVDWIEVTDSEREHLGTNVLSISKNVLIARKSKHTNLLSQKLRGLGYTVEEVLFDGVPAIGGSFRCASLALIRQSE